MFKFPSSIFNVEKVRKLIELYKKMDSVSRIYLYLRSINGASITQTSVVSVQHGYGGFVQVSSYLIDLILYAALNAEILVARLTW